LELGFSGRKGWNDESGGNGGRVDTEEAEMRGTHGMGAVYLGVGLGYMTGLAIETGWIGCVGVFDDLALGLAVIDGTGSRIWLMA
jgi:hypothetical protein